MLSYSLHLQFTSSKSTDYNWCTTPRLQGLHLTTMVENINSQSAVCKGIICQNIKGSEVTSLKQHPPYLRYKRVAPLPKAVG